MKKLLSLLLTTVMIFACLSAAFAEETAKDTPKTEIWASEESPTGYYVTFRYVDPEAERVRLYGEFMFAKPYENSLYVHKASTEWTEGSFPMYGDGWATVEMEKNEDGVWEYTLALPNGTFSYRFMVGGDEGTETKDTTGATMHWDPSRVPLRNSYDMEGITGGDHYLSTIYVPYDETKNVEDRRIEAPRDGENGEVSYFTINCGEEYGERTYGLYLPYGLDLNREEPYRVLVLNHGAGGYEGSWINQGAMAPIFDNCIAEGILEPTIVVTPKTSDLDSYMDALDNYVFPYLAENYNASLEKKDHAIAGLSAGAALITRVWVTRPTDFAYYCQFSGYWLDRAIADYQPDLSADVYKDLNITFVCGTYDQLSIAITSLLDTQKTMTENGIPYKTVLIDTGHTWYLWMRGLAFICQNVLWK